MATFVDSGVLRDFKARITPRGQRPDPRDHLFVTIPVTFAYQTGTVRAQLPTWLEVDGGFDWDLEYVVTRIARVDSEEYGTKLPFWDGKDVVMMLHKPPNSTGRIDSEKAIRTATQKWLEILERAKQQE
ncbi:uncharacterized protein PSFLO_02214 [Pseudozyma flocculosa]|uniref:Uncharacterized protein n=1 Tax=Pseudozyma flocculosa TaxID=84751 RepID=A0A5C3EWU7_9BASI|nr:uncharacterized protein PSFLO_02214 [Pseudozyma flocculosa]